MKEHIVVRVKEFFNEEMKKGAMTLLVNTTFRPEHHIRCYGEVMSVPDILPKYPIASNTVSRPRSYAHPRYEHKGADDIALELKVGDRAYFHYNCLLPDKETSNYNFYYMNSERVPENGEIVEYHYFRIKYELVFASVRYEKLNAVSEDFKWFMEADLVRTEVDVPSDRDDAHGSKPLQVRYVRNGDSYRKVETMIGSYVFVIPDKETWDDISIPTPETLDGKILYDVKGQPVMKPKEEWLVTKSLPGNKPLQGWVCNVGSPLKGDRCELKVGMYVYFKNYADTVLFYEGVEVYRLRQRNVYYYAPHKFRAPEKTPALKLELI